MISGTTPTLGDLQHDGHPYSEEDLTLCSKFYSTLNLHSNFVEFWRVSTVYVRLLSVLIFLKQEGKFSRWPAAFSNFGLSAKLQVSQ